MAGGRRSACMVVQKAVWRARVADTGGARAYVIPSTSDSPSGSPVDSLVIACSRSMLCPYYLLMF